ncbi:SigE family RNA polymerase sigma factor [Streptomyces virginiae]|uniref:SigE family RNA polymerase sigma factor n=1 Tax=Streptomyces virginiae TaxID=1961 RepID=UPI0030E51778
MRRARRDGFGEFAASRSGHLHRSACLLVGGDTRLAEDLVRETLGRMYLRWGRISRVDDPAAYAQTVLVRVFLTHQRRRSPQERPVGELPDAVAPTLLEALGRLAPKDRAVLVLRYWEDRSVEETADAMNTGSAAIRTRTSRALDRLREQLGGDLTAFVDR